MDEAPRETLDTRITSQLLELDEEEPGFLCEVIDSFFATAEVSIVQMKGAIEVADLASLRAAAHTVRGSGQQLGARRFGATCARLERVERVQDAAPMVGDLENDLEAAREALTALADRALQEVAAPAADAAIKSGAAARWFFVRYGDPDFVNTRGAVDTHCQLEEGDILFLHTDGAAATTNAEGEALGLRRLAGEELFQLLRVQDLVLEERFRDPPEGIAILRQDALRPGVLLGDHVLDLVVDLEGGRLGVVLMPVELLAQEDGLFLLAVRQRTEGLAHRQPRGNSRWMPLRA